MNSVASKIIAVVVSLALLCYVGFQLFEGFYSPYETETVSKRDYSKSVDLDGFAVRDETVLPGSSEGVVSYNYKNSEKVPSNSVIASVYAQKSDLYNVRKAQELSNKISMLKKAGDKTNLSGMKPDLLNAQVSNDIMTIVESVDSGDLSKLSDLYDDLGYNMDRLAVCLDNNLSYDENILKLQAEYDSLTAQTTKAIQTIQSEEAGYFSNNTDGYESIFTTESLENISVASFREMNKATPKKTDTIGKLQVGSRWNFVSEVPLDEAESFKIGNTVTLKFSSGVHREIEANVLNVVKDKDGAVVVFSCGYVDEDIITMRFEKPQAILNTYNGIVIPAKALRIKQNSGKSDADSTTYGVYVLINDIVKFKKLDIIYKDSYVVISKPSISADYVAAFDAVIIKGNVTNEQKD